MFFRCLQDAASQDPSRKCRCEVIKSFVSGTAHSFPLLEPFSRATDSERAMKHHSAPLAQFLTPLPCFTVELRPGRFVAWLNSSQPSMAKWIALWLPSRRYAIPRETMFRQGRDGTFATDTTLASFNTSQSTRVVGHRHGTPARMPSIP
jgi:hypothetical protein